MAKLVWLRHKFIVKTSPIGGTARTEQSQNKYLLKKPVKKPVWALFFWLAQFRRWLRYLERDCVALGMYLITRKVYQVEVRGQENFKYDPATIVACSHKRDGDIPLFISRLYLFQRPSRRRALRMIYTATRDDLYETGFITLYFPMLGTRFRWLVARLRVARLIKQMQSCPVKLPDEQTVNQLLHETRRLEGNLRLQDALQPPWQVQLLGEASLDKPDLRLWDAILKAPVEVLAQYATPRIFKEPLATHIVKRHHQTVIKQLYQVSRILDKGGVIFIAPEGRVSPDGRFGKMRAALNRVVQQTRADVKMTPINITYDFMESQRPLVIINIGPEVLNLKRFTKIELAEVVRREVAGLACVTMSGLVSRALIEAAQKGTSGLLYRELEAQLWDEASRLRAAGLPMDRRLENRAEFGARLERFVAYACKRGQIFLNSATELQAVNADTWLELDQFNLLREECRKPEEHPVRYCYNELLSLLEAHELLEKAPAEAPALLNLAAERARRRTAG